MRLTNTVLAVVLINISFLPISSAQQSIWNVGSNMRHPPFSYWEKEGLAAGIEVDIVSLAAQKLNAKVNFVELPFGELIAKVNEGKLDLAVSTIGITADRAKKVDFSSPYFETEIVALVMPDSKHQTLAPLQNLKIGADRATTSYTAAKTRWPNASFVTEPVANSTWPAMLKEGTVDAFIVDASDQDRLENESGIKLRRIREPLKTEKFCIAVRKGEKKALDAVNQAVESLLPSVHLRIGHELQTTLTNGRNLYSLKNPPVKLVDDYLEAEKERKLNPDSADSIIWHGRRAGYLLRMNDAIAIFSQGIERFPDDERMYRHRGHRYISMRQFDSAIRDLEKAVLLIKDKPDQIEPDGAPNPQGIPLTTTHGNIWYHLGLAYYLKNDLQNALRCYNQRIELERYDDNIVANGHWKYMILRRLGESNEAETVVKNVRPEMSIIENMSYHKMCLFYGKHIPLSELNLEIDGTSAKDVTLYGVGNWYLYDKQDKRKARELFNRLFEKGSPYSFAFIAAEADYAREFVYDKKR